MRPDGRPFRGERYPVAGSGHSDAGLPDGGDPGRAELAIDADLASVDHELAAAGGRARSTEPDLAPSPAFAADLRSRLLAQLPTAAPTPVIAGTARLADPAGRSVRSGPAATAAARPAAALPGGSGQPLQPRVAWRGPTVLPGPRWTALAVAAALVLAVVGLDASRLRPAAPDSRVGAVADATLVRGATSRPLERGATLLVGDRVDVGPAGFASLTLGASQVRLAGGASLRLDVVDADRVVVDQLAGRAWHRVVGDPGDTYTVETAALDWTARGTAFDLDRTVGAGGGQVTIRAIEHDVRLAGPDLTATIEEGRRATVRLGDGPTDLVTGEIPEAFLADPWVLANARLDAAAGWPLGILAGVDLGTPEPTASPTPSATTGPLGSPSASPASPTPVVTTPPLVDPTAAPSPAPTHRPTPKPTAKPTPKPTPVPTPTPTPAPTLGTIGLAATACPGGVVLDWTGYAGDAFNHYLTMRSASASIPATYPPTGGASEVETSFVGVIAKTDGFDRTADGGTSRSYRTIVFDAEDRALAASPVSTVTTKSVAGLGGLTAGPGVEGTAFGWSPFSGPGECFTYYKLVWSAESSEPSYLGANDGAIAVEGQASSGTTVALPSGTWHVRLQAIRATSLGKFVVAQTTVTEVVVP